MHKEKSKYTSLNSVSSDIIHHARQSDFIYSIPSRYCNNIKDCFANILKILLSFNQRENKNENKN